ncbi:hypothetical protein HMPREF2958_09750 [Rothia sp. HMSC036D11]|nr:hypothetical protein HMPREF2958_09750 [Rothia sp. HMSC036D11]
MAEPVWMLVMFDLPVKTKSQRNLANKYRHALLDMGFDRLQLSVYCKYYINGNATGRDLFQLQIQVPPGGAVRIMKATDSQWVATIRYLGPQRKNIEEPPDALDVF